MKKDQKTTSKKRLGLDENALVLLKSARELRAVMGGCMDDAPPNLVDTVKLEFD